MITITSPSMALNDRRIYCAYTMDFNESVDQTTSVQAMNDMVRRAARAAPGGRLRNLVFNAHGKPGSLALGAGLDSHTMLPFGGLGNVVYKIWFTGCLTARIAGPQTARHGDGAALNAFGVNAGDGHAFIQAFARLTGCYVVAPTEIQTSARTSYPRGRVDSYEGLVLCYDPRGKISWRHRYQSLYAYNPSDGTAFNPNRE